MMAFILLARSIRGSPALWSGEGFTPGFPKCSILVLMSSG